MSRDPMGRRAWRWYRCYEPCAFENMTCGHRDSWTQELCDKLHTHYQYTPGSIQDIWAVRCDEHVPEKMRG